MVCLQGPGAEKASWSTLLFRFNVGGVELGSWALGNDKWAPEVWALAAAVHPTALRKPGKVLLFDAKMSITEDGGRWKEGAD
jgi:hypothetical protein